VCTRGASTGHTKGYRDVHGTADAPRGVLVSYDNKSGTGYAALAYLDLMIWHLPTRHRLWPGGNSRPAKDHIYTKTLSFLDVLA